jgi:hypothetical protein
MDMELLLFSPGSFRAVNREDMSNYVASSNVSVEIYAVSAINSNEYSSVIVTDESA